jgi:small subunit ribosomal protein S5
MKKTPGKLTGNKLNKSPMESLEQAILQIKAVTKVTKGGRQRRLIALVLVKREKGIAFGYSRGKDAATAIKKATRKASKNLVTYFAETPRTIPRDLKHSFKATEIHLFPAPAGSGLIAGGVVNLIFKYLGVQDVSAKIIGSRNKTNVVKCTFQALDEI